MRLLFVSFALLGCASHIRTEFVGTGTGVVTTRTATSPPPVGGGVMLPRGTYDIDLRFNLPRAQLVEWKVTCPGVEQTGRLGESFETYRDRRLMEMRSEWSRRKKAEEDAREAAENSPPTTRTTTTRVRTPVGAVTTTTTRVVAPAPIPLAGPEPTELRPGDLGGGTLPATTRIDTTADGACSIVAVTDDPDVMVAYQIIRIRDLRAEANERRQTLHAGAITARSRVSAQLVTYGADVDAKKRRLEADARLRADAERKRGLELAKQREIELRISLEARRKADEQRRLRLEAEARLEWEREAPLRARAELLRKQRALAITTRVTVVEWLVGTCHADPDRRDRIARQREAERLERERLIAIRIEQERVERERLLRIKLEAERVQRVEREKRMAVEYLERQRLRDEAERARIAKLEAENARRAKEAAALAELELRRSNEALRIRANLTSSLVARGAKLRPPRPAPLPETPGPIPFDGAEWIAGSWTWVSLRGEWVWTAGGWRDTARFGNAGNSGIVVHAPVTPPVVVTPAVVVTPPVVETVERPGVVIDVNVGGNARGRVVRDRAPRDRYDNPRPNRPRDRPTRVRDSRDNAPHGNATRAPHRKDDAKRDDKRR